MLYDAAPVRYCILGMGCSHVFIINITLSEFGPPALLSRPG